MADSYRLQVLKALCSHLEGIVHVEGDPENDWDGFNLQGKVFRGRSQFGDNAPDQFLSILEAPRPGQDNMGGEYGEARHEEWPLLLQGWTNDDLENPSDPVYALLDVVERRLHMLIATRAETGSPLYPNAFMLGKKITSFAYGPGVVRPPTEGISSKAFMYLPLRVGLAKVR